MKSLLVLAIGFLCVFARAGVETAATTGEMSAGDSVYFNGETLNYEDAEGAAQEAQCRPGTRPVVVCKTERSGGRLHGCRPGTHFCRSSFPGQSRCVPNSKPCGK